MASLWKMKWICTAIRTDFYAGQGIYFSALFFLLQLRIILIIKKEKMFETSLTFFINSYLQM
jgi:hypothetical protein